MQTYPCTFAADGRTISIVINAVLVAIGCCGARPTRLHLVNPHVLDEIWVCVIYPCIHHAHPHLPGHSTDQRVAMRLML